MTLLVKIAMTLAICTVVSLKALSACKDCNDIGHLHSGVLSMTEISMFKMLKNHYFSNVVSLKK